jgi:hypothetical protein
LTYEARRIRPNPSLASSITKLGIVRFVLPQPPTLPTEDARRGGIIELPSFSNEDTSRPTVQMPPIAERRESPAAPVATPAPAPTPPRPRVSTMLGMMRIP